MLLINIINAIFFAFYVLLFASIILSWVRPNPYHPTWGPVIRVVNGIVDPILNPIRRLLPPLGGLDFSPMVVLLLARVLQGALIRLVI
jgi:YggT family protein